jgi:hypothetical protein
MFDALHSCIPCYADNIVWTASFHNADNVSSNEKSRPKAALSSKQWSTGSVVIDDDLAAIMVHIPVVIALVDDDRVVIARSAVANYVALPNHVDVTIATAFADCHTRTDRADAHTHANFFRKCRQRSSDHRGGRDRSYKQFHVLSSSFN